MSKREPPPPARLEARLPADIYALLKRAAELQGRSLSDFVVSAAREAAVKAIDEMEIIRLSQADQMLVAEALMSPPEPSQKLKAVARLHANLIEQK